MDRFLVGSQYFFKDIEGFTSKDIDYLELVANPSNFKYSYQITGKGKCLFKWKRLSPIEFVDITLTFDLPMAIGKFLIPEFSKEIGFTIEHLKMLKPLVDKMDDKHAYEKVIYDAYIENNDFYLTDNQLQNSYNEYKKYR